MSNRGTQRRDIYFANVAVLLSSYISRSLVDDGVQTDCLFDGGAVPSELVSGDYVIRIGFIVHLSSGSDTRLKTEYRSFKIYTL